MPTPTPNMWLRSRVKQVLRERPDIEATILQQRLRAYPLDKQVSDRYGFDVAMAVTRAINEGLMTEAEALSMVEYMAREGRWAY